MAQRREFWGRDAKSWEQSCQEWLPDEYLRVIKHNLDRGVGARWGLPQRLLPSDPKSELESEREPGLVEEW